MLVRQVEKNTRTTCLVISQTLTVMSNSITHQNQFENQELDAAYGSSIRHNNASFSEALGAFHSSEISHTRHLMDLLGAANQNIHHHQPQGLSLSLGSHMHQRPLNSGLINPNYFMSGVQEAPREPCNPQVEHLTSDYFFNTGSGSATFASSSSSIPLNRSPSTSCVAESFAAVIGNSRYLKPVQSLLQDLVDVGGNVVDRINEKYAEKLFRGSRGGARTLSSELRAELRNNGPLIPDKHEHQIKIARLISLLDEVGFLCQLSLLWSFSEINVEVTKFIFKVFILN